VTTLQLAINLERIWEAKEINTVGRFTSYKQHLNSGWVSGGWKVTEQCTVLLCIVYNQYVLVYQQLIWTMVWYLGIA